MKLQKMISLISSEVSKENYYNSTEAIPMPVSEFKEVHNLIKSVNWSPSIFKDNYRKIVNFDFADFLAVDIDDGLNIEKAVERLLENNLNYSITPTTNHQRDKKGLVCDRMRILLPLSNRISTVTIFKNTVNDLRLLFPEADELCFEPARFYLASKGKILHQDLNSLYYDTGEHYQINQNIYQVVKSAPVQSASFFESAHTGIPGEWNDLLNKKVFELSRTGFSREKIMKMVETVAPFPLDSTDLATIKSAEGAGHENEPLRFKGPLYFTKAFEYLKIGLKNQIHICEDKKGTRTILEQINNNVVKHITDSALVNIITNFFYGTTLFDDPAKMKKIKETYKSLSTPLVEDISPVEFKSSKFLTFHRLDFDPSEEDTPLFDELIFRTCNGRALMAFIWSLFEKKSNKQQYIWLYGEGADGKGSLSRFLEKCLSEAYCSASTTGYKNDKFYTSTFVGKRLAVFNDIVSTSFITSSIFKELTGGDLIKVERKGKDAFTAKMHIKFIFNSNSPPNLSSQFSDQRRTIICRIERPTEKLYSHYEEDLWKERAGILHKCELAYKDLVNNHGMIKNDDSLAKEYAEDAELPLEIVFDSLFELDPNGSMTPKEINRTAFDECKRYDIPYNVFRSWMLRKSEVKKSRNTGKRQILGIRSKDNF